MAESDEGSIESRMNLEFERFSNAYQDKTVAVLKDLYFHIRESAKERDKIAAEISELRLEVQKSIELTESTKFELLRKIMQLQESATKTLEGHSPKAAISPETVSIKNGGATASNASGNTTDEDIIDDATAATQGVKVGDKRPREHSSDIGKTSSRDSSSGDNNGREAGGGSGTYSASSDDEVELARKETNLPYPYPAVLERNERSSKYFAAAAASASSVVQTTSIKASAAATASNYHYNPLINTRGAGNPGNGNSGKSISSNNSNNNEEGEGEGDHDYVHSSQEEDDGILEEEQEGDEDDGDDDVSHTPGTPSSSDCDYTDQFYDSSPSPSASPTNNNGDQKRALSTTALPAVVTADSSSSKYPRLEVHSKKNIREY